MYVVNVHVCTSVCSCMWCGMFICVMCVNTCVYCVLTCVYSDHTCVKYVYMYLVCVQCSFICPSPLIFLRTTCGNKLPAYIFCTIDSDTWIN